MTDRWMEKAKTLLGDVMEGKMPLASFNRRSEHIAKQLAAAYEAGRKDERGRANFEVKRFMKAPCYLCGYNGHSYYQPSVHKCAEIYHAALKGAADE